MPVANNSGNDRPGTERESASDSPSNSNNLSRDLPDVRQLYRSISGDKSHNQSPTDVKRSNQKSPLFSRHNSSHIISNPMSFFNRWGEDPLESRYSSEEDEGAARDDNIEQEGVGQNSENRPESLASLHPDGNNRNAPTSPQSRRASAIQNFSKLVSRSNVEAKKKKKEKQEQQEQQPF